MAENVGQRKRALYKRLFHFCLIPQFLNLLFLIPEIFLALNRIGLTGVQYCKQTTIYDRNDFVMGLNVSVFTFGTFLYYLGFAILFPAVRKAFVCQSGKDE